VVLPGLLGVLLVPDQEQLDVLLLLVLLGLGLNIPEQ
jgi:hypothetical protein